MIRFLRRTPEAWLACLLALFLYGLAAGPMLFRQSIAPHYVYLADALLHGRLDVAQPPTSYDMLVVDGRNFVAQSPMPAILLMPVVALFGKDVSDVLFSVVVGALNVGLVQSMFKRRWLTLLFAFGTPHLYLAALGSTWFTAHVVAVFFGLLAVREALGLAMETRRTQSDSSTSSVPSMSPWFNWFLSGLWLACAGFSRPSMLFGAVFFLVLIWLNGWKSSVAAHTPRQAGAGRISSRLRVLVVDRRLMVDWRSLASFSVAIALGVAAHGVYNAARFGQPTDFGYQYDVGAPNITSTYLRYGGFNPRFAPCNLFVSILNPPEVNGSVLPVLYDVCGYLLDGVNLVDTSAPIAPNPLGMSLCLVTPAFVLLAAARGRESITVTAWIGLLATMIPLWMYHNTGSLQFGYRYWMDAAPMWLLLLAEPLRRFQTFAWGLILASVVINVWGFLWVFEKFAGASWWRLVSGG